MVKTLTKSTIIVPELLLEIVKGNVFPKFIKLNLLEMQDDIVISLIDGTGREKKHSTILVVQE